MVDALFADPRLARLYDVLDGPRTDLEAYVALLARVDAQRVVDLGCGTGCLALMLADAGLDVVGVDPAEASLDVARAKAGAERIRWELGSAEDLEDLGADAVTMTGNVAQVFVSDQDWAAALDGVHRALRPGGRLIFESRRPERQDWTRWPVRETVTVPGLGEVTHHRILTEVAPPRVSFQDSFVLPGGETVTSTSTLAFRPRAQLETSLRAAGFAVDEVLDASDRPGLEWVFVASR